MSGGQADMNGDSCAAARRAIHAPVCIEAADQLRAFCSEHGVTVTAFLDAVGHALADLRGLSDDKLSEVTPLLVDTLRRARRIDAARRARS